MLTLLPFCVSNVLVKSVDCEIRWRKAPAWARTVGHRQDSKTLLMRSVCKSEQCSESRLNVGIQFERVAWALCVPVVRVALALLRLSRAVFEDLHV